MSSYTRLNPLVRQGACTASTSTYYGLLIENKLFRYGNLVVCCLHWGNVGNFTGVNTWATIPDGFKPAENSYFCPGHTGSVSGESYAFARPTGQVDIGMDTSNVSHVMFCGCWYTNDA